MAKVPSSTVFPGLRLPRMALEDSRPLRLFAVFLLYVAQGLPIGLFWFAIPAWMAANGADAPDIATVLSFTALPWTLKLVNGFILDRYTYLDMGRRRAWIIGAQCTIVAGLVICALVPPGPTDILLLSLFGFLVNTATTFQDVGVDGLAVDIMPEEERAQASGMMFGGQAIGIAAGTALTGAAISAFGASAAYLVAAVILSAVVLFVVSFRERRGERHLPWLPGTASAAAQAAQQQRWRPILRSTWRSLSRPISLLWVPTLLARGVNYGVFTALTPILGVTTAGWSEAAVTSMLGTAQLTGGILGITLGAWLGVKLGPRRATLLQFAVVGAGSLLMLMLGDHWTAAGVVTAFIFGWAITDVLITVAALPISMALCDRRVAATQFTLYMAMSNFGITAGAALFGVVEPAGGIAGVFILVIANNVLGALSTTLVREDRLSRETPDALTGT